MVKYAKILSQNVSNLFHEFRGTQAEFAKRVGISQRMVSSFISGDVTNCELSTIEKIADSFGKDVLWMLTDHCAALRGLPPFFPFSRDACVFSGEHTLPPAFPISDAG